MYENMTFDVIMGKLLSNVASTMDKREGSVIYDALAPCAVELQNAYIHMDTILNETYADTASLYYLKKRAAERGIHQIMATKAILRGEFTPVEYEVPIGSRFSCDTLNYVVIERIAQGVYKLECETAGSEGNAHFGTLIPIEYLDGLKSANLSDLIIPASDDEDVESLRERYFNSLNSQAFGGNIADYKAKVRSIDGVSIGGIKVTPVWNGGGTVKLTIMDAGFAVPEPDLITKIKEAADPYPNDGKGYGFAPIGHIVTVEAVQGVTVNIATTITYKANWNWESTKSYILKAVDSYFTELNKAWEDSEGLTVRISQIESKILDCEGVVDVAGTTLNGAAKNISLTAYQIPVRGTVNGE